MNPLRNEFERRGLIEAVSSPDLLPRLLREPVTFYVGFDPTARSLQIGNLFVIVTMRRLQLAGHKPIAILGGGTGMIGDPSGKSAERNLLDEETIAANLAGQRAQMERLLDFGDGPADAIMLNNADWLGCFSFIEFLRDVGKSFRLGEMLARESVKRRLDSPEGMSFTEFTYQMLQAYDFLHLYRAYGVTLQIGGGDQWGNIVAGIDLIRKLEGAQAYGMTVPLVTDGQGKKFGKSEGGTIYLDPEITRPYHMYQYLLNSDDASVIRYLKYFTFLPLEEIDALEKATADNPGARAAQKALASHLTELVHGPEGLRAAEQATRIFFGERIDTLSEAELEAIFADVPTVAVARDALAAGIPVLDLLAQTPLFKSKGEARRAIQQKGAYLNNAPIASIDETVDVSDLVTPTALVLRKGKKNYALVRAAG